jgi:two-component system sensor histidine kinase RegB
MRGPPALLAGLRQLMILRTIAVAGQIAAIATSSILGIALPLAAMIAVIAALAALNAATWIRLQRAFRANHVEIGGHLAFDLAAFTLLLYLAGGSQNPFALLFVLHVVLIALLLPSPPAAMGTLLVVGCFSFVDRIHLPLQLANGDPPAPALMAFGEWLSFALTSAVVAWFVVRNAGTLREHERMLRDATQKALNDETILKLGALAAGAAHELTTPMTTMAVVADEIGRQANTASLQRDVGILRSQIETCRQRYRTSWLQRATHARKAAVATFWTPSSRGSPSAFAECGQMWC